MSNSTKVVDLALQGAGQRIGTEIWRIENFQPVPLPKSEFGKFYSGDSYIVLQTTAGKGGAYLYDIHFWLGKDTSQDEAGTAAIKTVELDTILGGRAVQYRELQGYESEKFLSYFKPCIIPLEGGVASGFKKCEEETFEPRLYICKGRRVVKLKQVPFSRSSLNHDDVFILDTEKKIYQFNGANSNIQERAKALEVIQYFKEKYHDGTCEVAIIEDGKLVAESDSGEFWVLFGGFAPIGKKTISEDDISVENTPGKLYSIAESQPKLLAEDSLSKALLENNQCYLLDCGSEVFVWVGRITQVEERKAASQAAVEFISSQKRPKSTRIIQVIQGYETHSFKFKFESWPLGSGTSTAEEGRGKVAALLKQQGVDVKGKAKGAPTQEDVHPLLESGGRIEVWRINGSAKSPVYKEDIGKFYSGDCYIVLYTYHSGEKKEEYFLCCWLGKESLQDDQCMAIGLANTMHYSLRARPVMGRIFEGKEPPQFIALFNPLVVLKGGLSTGYKKTIAEKGSDERTYSSDSVALFRVSGASVHNSKVVQVDVVGTSLNSNDCFLLQSGSSMFSWHGNSSTFEQQQLAAKTAEFLKPGIVLKHAKEGTETSAFWGVFGGKQSYTSKNDASEIIIRDPHLYAYTINKGKFEITEIFNFAQDDLLTEDLLILGTHAEVFVWIGHSVDAEEKQKAFEIGQMYIDLAASLEGLSTDVPLFKIAEGNEPCFFTTYFSWDSSKAMAQGNSFEKKLFLLFGTALHLSEHHERSNGSSHGGPTQRASALAALNSAFNSSPVAKPSTPKRGSPIQGSQRAAAVAALSNVLTAEQKKASDTTPSRLSRSPSSADGSKNGSPMASEDIPEKESEEENVEPNVEINEADTPVKEEEQVDLNADQVTLSYEQLKAKSTNPAKGIDIKRREAYLCDSEFQTVLGMTKEAFYRQPKWKQDMQKRKVDLFC